MSVAENSKFVALVEAERRTRKKRRGFLKFISSITRSIGTFAEDKAIERFASMVSKDDGLVYKPSVAKVNSSLSEVKTVDNGNNVRDLERGDGVYTESPSNPSLAESAKKRIEGSSTDNDGNPVVSETESE